MIQEIKANKNKLLFAGLALVAAFSAGRFLGPRSMETKEIEKVVYREKASQDDKKQVRVETRETILPDGTRIVENISDTKTETRTDSERSLDSEKTKVSIQTDKPQWSVGLYTDRKFLAGTIDRRILGGVFLGVYGRTELPLSTPELGLGLRLEF